MSSESLIDRIKNKRSALYASPRFQKFCSGFLPTRFVARSKASAVFDLCAGFVYSQVLFACVRLDLLGRLQERSRTLSEISALTGLPEAGTERLIKAAIALELLESRSQHRFGLGPAGAAILGNPGLQQMIAHHDHFYADLADPVGLLQQRSKETTLAKYWRYSASSDSPPEERAAMQTYSDLMSTTQAVIADEILNAYPFHRHKHILDIGGGDGSFLRLAKAKSANAELSLLELPSVTTLARARSQEAGIPISVHSGNMFEDPWPTGADLITLIRVALDHDDDAVRILLSQARSALAPGGTLLLAEPMADSKKVGHAYFGMYLWAMGSGRARSTQELQQMLSDAGFHRVRTLRTDLPDLVRIITAA